MKRSPLTREQKARDAFTLTELLVSLGVLALIILLVAQLMSSATAISRPANKHIDTDTQARVVLDRMAVDFAKMLKRTDIDYYIKAPSGYKNPNSHGKSQHLKKGQLGNDQIAFFSEVPGYYPPSGSQSPVSLIAYRINNDSNSAAYLMLERMGKGLLWNGVNNGTSYYPIVFVTGQITASCTNKCPCSGTTGPWAGPWSAAICSDNADPDGSYDTIGPGVFRLEYYYLLKDGTVTDAPRVTGAVNWADSSQSLSAKLNAFGDVEAIGVAIAVIDPASRSLISQNQLLNLMSDLPDFQTASGNGYGNPKKTFSFLESIWEGAVENVAQTGATSDGSAFPPAAASAVRIYSRYFDVRSLPDF